MSLRPGPVLILLVGLSACTQTAPPMSRGYFGPTLSLDDLVRHINENSAKIPTLWAREHFNGLIVDRQQNKAAHVDGYGNLLYTGPNKMKLTADNELTHLFSMGSDGEKFWLYENHEQVFWWGDYASASKVDSGEIPVRPDMVMEILGIRPVNPNLAEAPVPVMRFNNAGDIYMVDWQQLSGDHWVVVKEIWYDRQTLLPQKVLLFDGGGHVAMWAMLSNFQKVEVPQTDEKDWPVMAARYDLSFPYSGSKITMELTDMTLSHKSFGKSYPNETSFQMPSPQSLAEQGVRVNHIE